KDDTHTTTTNNIRHKHSPPVSNTQILSRCSSQGPLQYTAAATSEIGVMRQAKKYSPEVRERAVRMVFEHESEYSSQWAAIQSIAEKIGCSGETLRNWVRQAERDAGQRPGPTTTERERIKELEREVRELRRANEILRKASAYFAQAELDRRPKHW